MNATTRFIIINVLILLAVAALLVIIILPNIYGIISLSNGLSSVSARLIEITKSTSAFKQTAQNLAEVHQAIAEHEISSKDDGNEVGLFAALDGFAKEARVEQTINLKDGKRVVGDIWEYTLDIKIRGTFPGLLEYLKKIDEFNALLTFDNIAISSIKSDNSAFTIDALLGGTVRLMR